MGDEPEIASKSEFARIINVTPGRVSQYIKAGQLHGEAIVGDGRDARIVVAIGKAQLRRYLDIGQRFGNGLSTRLDATGPASAAPAQIEAPLAPRPPTDPVEEQIKAARLEGLSRDNRKKAEEEAARSGRYTLTEAVKKQIGRIIVQVINMFDGWLAELASKISARFSIPQRDVLHLLRAEFRTFREGAAASLRSEAEGLAPLIEEEVADEEKETEGEP